jgi:hypothetical protein
MVRASLTFAALVALAATTTAHASLASDADVAPSATPVEAPVESTRLAHPVAVRGDVSVLYDGVFGSTDGFAGGTLAYALDEHASIEGTFGWGFGNVGKTGGNAIAMGRYAIPIDRAGVHAITFAIGPSVMFGGDYGTVWVARGEFAYELRTRGGFSLLVGAGPAFVLVDSKIVPTGCTGWFCPSGTETQFKAGDVPLHVRVSAGWAF